MDGIKISELHLAGSELFKDSESFLNELDESEAKLIEGGQCYSFVSVKYVQTVGANSEVILVVSCNSITAAPSAIDSVRSFFFP